LPWNWRKSPAVAQDDSVKEPVCQPIGRTEKGDLVYSMECRNIPGLKAGTAPRNTARAIATLPDGGSVSAG
jgi:hypothetical protein